MKTDYCAYPPQLAEDVECAEQQDGDRLAFIQAKAAEMMVERIGRQLDPPPCEWSFVAEGSRVICDDQLHIVSPAGRAPCRQCDKEYCRVCSPRRCPKCGWEEKEGA